MRAALAIVLALLPACGPSNELVGDTGADATPDGFVDLPWDGPELPDVASWGCLEDLDCDDSDPCTADSCDLGTHLCLHDAVHGQALAGPDVRLTDSPGVSTHPELAWTGSALGIAWTDGRISGCMEFGPYSCPTKVWFTQVDSSGAELSPAIVFSGTEDSRGGIVIDMLWTGSRYAAAWNEWFGETADFPRMALVEADGAEISDGLAPSAAVDGGSVTDLAFTGSSIAMAWTTYGVDLPDMPPDAPMDAYLTLFDPAGTETSTELLRHFESGYYRYMRVAWTGSAFAIPYSDFGSALILAGPDGTVTGETTYPEEIFFGEPEVVWTGSELALFWATDDPTADPPCAGLDCMNIYMLRLAPDGSVAGDAVQVTGTGTRNRWRQVSWTGSEIALSWTDVTGWGEENWLTRLSAEGDRIAEDFPLPGASAFAWTGSEYALVWSDMRSGDWELYMNRLLSCE